LTFFEVRARIKGTIPRRRPQKESQTYTHILFGVILHNFYLILLCTSSFSPSQEFFGKVLLLLRTTEPAN